MYGQKLDHKAQINLVNTLKVAFLARPFEVTSASALQLWLKFCMQGFFSKTANAIALKLHTLIGHHQMTLQDKAQYSLSDFDTIMPLFGIRNSG